MYTIREGHTFSLLYFLAAGILSLPAACNDKLAAREGGSTKPSASGGSGSPAAGAASGGASMEPGDDATGGTGASANEASGGQSSVGGQAAIGEGGASPSLPTDIIFEFDPSLDKAPEVCAAKQLQAQEVLLDMFIILDQSGSMNAVGIPTEFCPISASGEPALDSAWCNAITALDGFWGDPSSVGMGVAYAEFAGTGCAAFSSMDVPFALIEEDDTNGHLSALYQALADDDPNGNTATEGAIRTLIEQTSNHMPALARKSVNILITDGAPSECDEDGGAIAELGQLNALLLSHYRDTGVPTYVIGMEGAQGDLLELLAEGVGAERHSDHCLAPHTECSYYSVGRGDPIVFLKALESIREEVLGCEYSLPEAETGVSALDSLEVKYTQETGAKEQILERVTLETDCSSDGQYWVDASGSETVVKLCPMTCERRGPSSAVDLALTCEGT